MIDRPVDTSANIGKVIAGEPGNEVDHHFDAIGSQEMSPRLKSLSRKISTDAAQRAFLDALEADFHSSKPGPAHLLSHPWDNRFRIAFCLDS